MTTREDAQELLSAAERLYALGGPVYNEGVAHDPDDWHGGVLSLLNDPANMDPKVFAKDLHGYNLDGAAGLRVLVRLSAATAVAKAVRYMLGQAPHDGSTRPATQQDVLDEICLTQSWLPDDLLGVVAHDVVGTVPRR